MAVQPRIIINPYNGDPDLLEFFIEQVKTKVDGTKRSEAQILNYVKSKLIDKALKFYVSSIPCQKEKNANELFNIFRKNFKGDTEQSIALQYNNLKFEPHENIRTFANKLQNILYKHFPKISQDSIDQILIAKFSDTILLDFKIHLLLQNKEKYTKNSKRIQIFQ